MGNIEFEGKGTKTVDFHEIKRRFNSLKVNTDWTEMARLQKIRNYLEHYYETSDPKIAHEILSSAFVIICNFLVNRRAIKSIW